MSTIALVAAVLGVIGALGSVVIVGLASRRRFSDTAALQDSFSAAAVLHDPRSCFQTAIESFSEAIRRGADDHARRAAEQLVNLLSASPALVFKEVIDDEALVQVERETDAMVVWIVSSNEAIEFEYPDPVTSFSQVVIDNLKRGVNYRYLVVDTQTTRERSQKITQLANRIGEGEHLQIRFLPPRYWEALERNTSGLIVFDGKKRTPQMYYVFPGTFVPGLMRKWIQAPPEDAKERSRDLSATWELADEPNGPERETGVTAASPRRTSGG